MNIINSNSNNKQELPKILHKFRPKIDGLNKTPDKVSNIQCAVSDYANGKLSLESLLGTLKSAGISYNRNGFNTYTFNFNGKNYVIKKLSNIVSTEASTSNGVNKDKETISNYLNQFSNGLISSEDLLKQLKEQDIYAVVTKKGAQTKITIRYQGKVYGEAFSKEDKISDIMKSFTSGNMTVQSVEQFLKLQKISYQVKTEGNNTVISFVDNGKKYMLTCNSEAAKSADDLIAVVTYSAEKLSGYDANLIKEYFDVVAQTGNTDKLYKLKDGKKYSDFLIASFQKISSNPGMEPKNISASGSWYAKKNNSKNGVCIQTVQTQALDYLQTKLKQLYRQSFNSRLKSILSNLGYTSANQDDLFEAYFAQTVKNMKTFSSRAPILSQGYTGWFNQNGWASIDCKLFVDQCTQTFNEQISCLMDWIVEMMQNKYYSFDNVGPRSDSASYTSQQEQEAYNTKMKHIEQILFAVKNGEMTEEYAEKILYRNYNLTYNQACQTYASSSYSGKYLKIDATSLPGFLPENLPSSHYYGADEDSWKAYIDLPKLIDESLVYTEAEIRKGGKAEADFRKYIENNNLKNMMKESCLSLYSNCCNVFGLDISELFENGFNTVMSSDVLFQCLVFEKENNNYILSITDTVINLLRGVTLATIKPIEEIEADFGMKASQEGQKNIDTTLTFDFKDIPLEDWQKELEARDARVGDMIIYGDTIYTITGISPVSGDFVLKQTGTVSSDNNTSGTGDKITVSMNENDFNLLVKELATVTGINKKSILDDKQEFAKFINYLKTSTEICNFEGIKNAYFNYIRKSDSEATMLDMVTITILTSVLVQLFTGSENERVNQQFLDNNNKSFRVLFIEQETGRNNNDQYGIHLQGNYGWTTDPAVAGAWGYLDAFVGAVSLIPGVGTIGSIVISIITDVLELVGSYDSKTGSVDWVNFLECVAVDVVMGLIPGAKCLSKFFKKAWAKYLNEALSWGVQFFMSNMNIKGPEQINNRNPISGAGGSGPNREPTEPDTSEYEQAVADLVKKVAEAVIVCGDLDEYFNDDGETNHYA